MTYEGPGVAHFETLLMLEFEVYPGITEVVLRLPDGSERVLGRVMSDDQSVTRLEGWKIRNGIHIQGAQPFATEDPDA